MKCGVGPPMTNVIIAPKRSRNTISGGTPSQRSDDHKRSSLLTGEVLGVASPRRTMITLLAALGFDPHGMLRLLVGKMTTGLDGSVMHPLAKLRHLVGLVQAVRVDDLLRLLVGAMITT